MVDFFGYPPVAFYFKVAFHATLGTTDTSFQEVSGISTEIELDPVEEGGENRFKHQLPKGTKSSNLMLKRGLASMTSPLVVWCKATLESGFAATIVPTSLSVFLMNEMSIPIRGWSFHNAYPVKWSVGGFDSMKNELAIETIELSYNYFTRYF